MARVIIVYGPAASGKTHNAEELRALYGQLRVVDNWNGHTYLKPGDLVLTNSGYVRQMSYDQLRQIIAIPAGQERSMMPTASVVMLDIAMALEHLGERQMLTENQLEYNHLLGRHERAVRRAERLERVLRFVMSVVKDDETPYVIAHVPTMTTVQDLVDHALATDLIEPEGA
jgi:hypothetical protein